MIDRINKYPGQKKINGVFQAIINEIPKCTDFYEVFCGSAQLSKIIMSICPDIKIHLNDLDSAVIDKYSFPSAVCTNLHSLELLSVIEKNDYEGSIMFIDPPYQHCSRIGNEKLYTFEMSDQDHIDFFNYVSSSKIKMIIIHPKNCIYDKLINLGWRYKEIKIRYHNKTSIERIYCNYAVPVELMTYKYIGINFTDRQRIKRKCERFSKKLQLLPVIEREAIINHLIKTFK